ncbi:SPOSA6832_04756 [Sporobolomyces salmonicolor]|uniref:SPOSA6832_04756-mRNA-1:cds n=1 Tax=Sporidiobolus salmonicolor TaxID=5005 RepID=A0A0D6ESE2_SPOSA|nr:SPOSA6832_04756 [Sporobolomyces salmonicolor]
MFFRGLSALAISLAALSGHVHAARETLDEAAVHTRELIAYRAYNTGILMSTSPAEAQSPIAGLPFGLVRSRPPLSIYRNAMPPHKPNLTLTINDMYGFGDGNLAAGRMRVALFGTLERVEGDDEIEQCKQAYLTGEFHFNTPCSEGQSLTTVPSLATAHPDARGWIPPHGPHDAFYARMRVHQVYAFNGFGDVAYIGWIPLDLYRESGSKMRSAKEVHKSWPVPRQPEEEVEVADLFRDSVAGEGDEQQERFKIQW